MAQLARIGAVVDWRWSLKKDLWGTNKESKKKDEDNEEVSEDGPKESQGEVKKETLLSTSY